MKGLVNAAVLFSALVLSVFLGEVFVRLLGMHPHRIKSYSDLRVLSSRFGYQNKPDKKATHTESEFQVGVSQNSKGLRGPERPYKKEKGAFRIVILGDSFMWGYGVAQDKIFPERLERELEKKGKRVETINSGVPSYSATPELLWLENEGLKYEPDLVVLAFYPGNDVEDPDEKTAYRPYFVRGASGRPELRNFPASMEKVREHYLRAGAIRSRPFSWKVYVSERFALYWFLKNTLKFNPVSWRVLKRLGLIEPEDLAGQGAFEIYGDYANEKWRRRFGWTADLVAVMKERSAAAGADFMVVMVPERFRVEEASWILTRNAFSLDGRYSPDGPALAMMAAFQKRGIKALDLAPALKRDPPGERLYFRIDAHWNARGHEKAARAVAEALAGQIPSR